MSLLPYYVTCCFLVERFGSWMDLLQLIEKVKWPQNKRTLREMALEVGSLEMKGNENDVNRLKTTNSKAREVIIEMKEYDLRERVGD